MGISIPQLIIILVIIILIFGTKKLRNMGSDLGGAMKSFKSAINEKENAETSDEGRVIEGQAEQTHEVNIEEKEKH